VRHEPSLLTYTWIYLQSRRVMRKQYTPFQCYLQGCICPFVLLKHSTSPELYLNIPFSSVDRILPALQWIGIISLALRLLYTLRKETCVHWVGSRAVQEAEARINLWLSGTWTTVSHPSINDGGVGNSLHINVKVKLSLCLTKYHAVTYSNITQRRRKRGWRYCSTHI
jgi:hypothetical protein